MNGTNYIIWLVMNLGWFAVISLLQYPVRKRRMIPLRIVLIVAKFLVGSAMAYTCMVTNIGYSFWGSYLMASLYVALLGDVAGDIISFPFVLKNKEKSPNGLQMTLCAVCAWLYLIYGTVNMQTVTANEFTITSDKLDRSHTVVFLSDLHVGSSQSFNTVKKTVRKVEAAKPEMVLLGGDIVDEYTTKEEMENVFALFGGLDAPVYYAYGNHDRQPFQHACGGYRYTPDELDAALEANGIIALKDEWVQAADDIVVIGREDCLHAKEDRKDWDEIPAYPKDDFVLVLDHSPYQTEDIIKSGADLQLSGHTHAAQLFPFNWVYILFGYDSYGFYHHGDTTLYVSSGASGWCFPFRSEKGCHYEVITLTPEQ